MSYRECRSLCEMLRTLGYNRIVSLENFAKPNFELVADLLYWFALKYDPQSQISDDINEEKDRVEFMKSIINIFTVKARIKLNPKKLYHADADAVPELLRIASVLYKSKPVEEEDVGAFALPAKVSNLKAYKTLSNEICEVGARLYDALTREPELKQMRAQALAFLEGMGGGEGGDGAYIEGCLRTIMQRQEESMKELTKYVGTLEKEQKALEDKLKKKTAELERSEKRYRNLLVVKPSFMEEYEHLEEEMARLHEMYAVKFRNIDHLETELDRYNRAEEERLRRVKEKLKKLENNARIRVDDALRNENELEERMLEAGETDHFSRGQSRKDEQRRKHDSRQQSKHEEKGDEDEDEQDDNEEDDNEDDDDASGEGIDEDDEDGDSDF